MKFRNLHKWHLAKELDGLVYFSQRFDELLFDYTPDSYKPTALNCTTLCEESLGVIQAIEDGHTDRANLQHVLDELIWSVQHDAVAKSLMDVSLELYVPLSPEFPIDELKIRLEVLGRTLRSALYIDRCSDRIKKAVVKGSKGEIDFLARSLATALINHGVSKAFLYQKTQDFFFRGDGKPIQSSTAISEFLDSIMPTVHDFDVYFLVSGDIKAIEKSLSAFDIKMLESFPEKVMDVATGVDFLPSESEVIVKIEEIRSYDCYSARTRAERKIDMLRDTFTLFLHRNRLNWREQTLIAQCCVDSPVVVGSQRSSMQKRVDPKSELAAARLGSLISGLGLRYGDSFEKFNRIVDLHGICVTNDVPENQLLNLWICLETLVPSRGAKLTGVLKGIEPFVRRNYIRRLVGFALRDLMIWDKRVAGKILKSVPDSKGLRMSTRLLCLLGLDTNEELRKQLYEALKDFHLLRFRLFSLAKIASSPKSVEEVVDAHWRKVEWQIRRIYRTRNALVHTGKAPSYLGPLIENGHDYLDMILEEIVRASCGDKKVRTLDQAFELEQLLGIGFQRRLAAVTAFAPEDFDFLCTD